MKDNNRLVLKTYGFTRANLRILAVSILLIVIGYVLLSGGRSTDEISFDPEVFNTMRTSVAPMVITVGYVGVLVAVLWKGKSKNESVDK